MEQWPFVVLLCNSGTVAFCVVIKCGGTVEQWPCSVIKFGGTVEQWPSGVIKCSGTGV